MELTHADYIRMGQLVTITVLAMMTLYTVIRRCKPVRGFTRRLLRDLQRQTRRSARYGIAVAALLFFIGTALLCFFFERFLFSMPDTLRGNVFSFVKVSVYWLGLLLSMDLTFVGGMLLINVAWEGLSRHK